MMKDSDKVIDKHGGKSSKLIHKAEPHDIDGMGNDSASDKGIKSNKKH